jgi:predicted RNA binding protein YcfA (HicA-like mRNA interferase family)
MPHIETSRRRIVQRLQQDGWVEDGGAKHAMFRHPDKPGAIIVPRHNTLTPGVARSIAKAAEWI